MDSLSYLIFVSCQLVFVSLQMCSSRTCGRNSSLQPLSIPNPLLPWWRAQFLDLKQMVLYVSTWEVLEDGNVGLRPITSPSFLLIPFRSQYLQDANSPSPVLNAVYSIDWAQHMAGLSKISNHPLVSLMVSASQRLLGRPEVNSYL